MSQTPFKIGQPKETDYLQTVKRDFEREPENLQQLEGQTKTLPRDIRRAPVLAWPCPHLL
uniref:Uncharacterized protein n=1 Tax=Rhinolophus ferrumequinum TaxID=59479 RepID=A0A671DXM5_RHIFE